MLIVDGCHYEFGKLIYHNYSSPELWILEYRRVHVEIFCCALWSSDSIVNSLIKGMEHRRKDFNCNGAVKHSPEERAPCLEPNMKNKNSADKVDVTVHLYNNTGCSGQWTSREKYLTVVCVLLFCACIAFVAVAFIRHREGTYLKMTILDCIYLFRKKSSV